MSPEQARRFHARERRKSLLDPCYELFRTHSFAPDAANIPTGTVFASRTKPCTFAAVVKITAGSAQGVILELGSATTGLAIWISGADNKLYACAGDAVAADGVTVSGPVTASGQILHVVFAVIPSSGKARLWVNGKLVAHGEATGGEFPNGWGDTGEGAVAAVDTDVNTRVPSGDRISLTNAVVIAKVGAYQDQRPRQFSEVA